MRLERFNHKGQTLFEIFSVQFVAQQTIGADGHSPPFGQTFKGKGIGAFVSPPDIGYDWHALTLQPKGQRSVAVGVPYLHGQWHFAVYAEIRRNYAGNTLEYRQVALWIVPDTFKNMIVSVEMQSVFIGRLVICLFKRKGIGRSKMNRLQLRQFKNRAELRCFNQFGLEHIIALVT